MKNLLIYLLINLLIFVGGCVATVEEVVEEPLLPAPIFRDPPFTPIYYWLPVAEVTIEEFETGRIIIPAIHVDLTMVGNVNVWDVDTIDRVLNHGPIYFCDTSPVSTNPGNSVIIGHRNGNRNFHYLDRLEPGDLIQIEIDHYQFTYTVEWQKILGNRDWSIHNEKPNYPALTLVTCEPKTDLSENPSHRLYIRARLQEVLTK